MIFVIIFLVAVIIVLVIACHLFYVAGMAKGFENCYKQIQNGIFKVEQPNKEVI